MDSQIFLSDTKLGTIRKISSEMSQNFRKCSLGSLVLHMTKILTIHTTQSAGHFQNFIWTIPPKWGCIELKTSENLPYWHLIKIFTIHGQ